jgi:transcription-repair coupling factor (superfamily II helicase)
MIQNRDIPDVLRAMAESSVIARIAAQMTEQRYVRATGQWGSCALVIAALIQERLGRPMLILTAHLDEADDAVDQLEFFRPGTVVRLFPAFEVLPGESNVSPELSTQRLTLLSSLASGDVPNFIVAPVQAVMQPCPNKDLLARQLIRVSTGVQLDREQLIDWLAQQGYTRLEAVENPGDFAVRGDILDIWPASSEKPARISFFDQQIEHLHGFDPETLGPTQDLQSLCLTAMEKSAAWPREQSVSLPSMLPENTMVWLIEPAEIQEQGKSYYDRLPDARGIYPPDAVYRQVQKFAWAEIHQFAPDTPQTIHLPCRSVEQFDTQPDAALAELAALAAEHQVAVVCQNSSERTRLTDLIHVKHPEVMNKIAMPVGDLAAGFRWNLAPDDADVESWLILIGHHELFHRYHQKRRLRSVQGARPIDHFLDLVEGDYVVHVQHGIAKYTGITTLNRDGRAVEYLTLIFARDATLHVPITQIHLVQKYVGSAQSRPLLSVLGGSGWSRQKEKVSEAVEKMAVEMLEVQAAREQFPGIAYPADTVWMREFENSFPFQATEDQLRCIAEIKEDLEKPRPMDRLLCGDVGYGKTELAIRSAFKVCEQGKQVAVLAPTTVLVEQHEQTFRDRMAGYPFVVESVSRFKTPAQVRDIIERTRQGQVDVLIGTHRLLSRDVEFADLGLVVIDEEQRFGVDHKERLKRLRLTVDVLTMTATPIPRTLHMSLLGIRDISNLATPPRDRRSVVTEVIGFEAQRIKQAVERELARDGQVYFVHNRVWNIQSIADKIQQLVPEARIVIGHGQMPDGELEQIMHRFIRREADILVSTTIIESGLDIPTANTIFIHEAEHFGLSDLHQLRGRVGRSRHRAYCYLILTSDKIISDAAAKRLKAMEEYNSLGAGFKIALRDLEIRGAGNLLGDEQSGHIASVGYELYCQLLEEAVKRVKNQPIDRPPEVNIDIGITGSLPRTFVRSEKQRMDLYRRLSRCQSLESLATLRQDITDAFGPLPGPAQTLLALTELRINAAGWAIASIISKPPDLVFSLSDLSRLGPLLAKAPGSVRPVDEKSIHLRLTPAYFQGDTLLDVLRNLFSKSEQTQKVNK